MSCAHAAGRLTVLLVTACVAAFANGATQRSFVASNGVDNLSCSIGAPCRSFAAAVSATSSRGEVIVLDSAGYGAVTITQSVSIIAPAGVYAGISVFTGDGVTVSAGAADNVVLRGLTINGQGGANGIHVTAGRETFIEDCTVANLNDGILIDGGSAVHIARIVARSNEAGVFVSVFSPTTITMTLADSTLTSNHHGIRASTDFGGIVNAAVSRVTAAANVYGFSAEGFNSSPLTMIVADSIATDGGYVGVYAIGDSATVIVSGSSLVGNASYDLYQLDLAVLRTAGDNAVTGRAAGDIGGTLTMNPLQ